MLRAITRSRPICHASRSLPAAAAIARLPAGLAAGAHRTFITTVDSASTGLVFRFGRYVDQKAPGLRFFVPIMHVIQQVSTKTQTLAVPPQELITRDNVTIHVDAVCFYRITDPVKAILEVEDYAKAVNEAAQTSLRAQLSSTEFNEILHDRTGAGMAVLEALEETAGKWGIKIESVQLKNISIDKGMIRAMSRRAEAERVREARLIEADAEVQASQKLREAAHHLAQDPGAMRLRELQTYAQIAAEGNTVLVPANMGFSVQAGPVASGRARPGEGARSAGIPASEKELQASSGSS